MSRRKKSETPRRRPPAGGVEATGTERRPAEPASPSRRAQAAPARRAATPGPSLLVQIALLIVVFVIATLIAELAGAANLGVAIGVGQIAFALALVALILRAP